MFGHLEVSIAGAPMSHHWTSGSAPDGVDVESNGSVVRARHKVSAISVRRGEARGKLGQRWLIVEI